MTDVMAPNLLEPFYEQARHILSLIGDKLNEAERVEWAVEEDAARNAARELARQWLVHQEREGFGFGTQAELLRRLPESPARTALLDRLHAMAEWYALVLAAGEEINAHGAATGLIETWIRDHPEIYPEDLAILGLGFRKDVREAIQERLNAWTGSRFSTPRSPTPTPTPTPTPSDGDDDGSGRSGSISYLTPRPLTDTDRAALDTPEQIEIRAAIEQGIDAGNHGGGISKSLKARILGHDFLVKPGRGARGDTIEDEFQPVAREVAAYDVARVLGWEDLVPVTVDAEHPTLGYVSAQAFIAGKVGYKADIGDVTKVDRVRASLLDFLWWNADRHGQNYFVKGENIRLIDHNQVFHKDDKYPSNDDLITYAKGTETSKKQAQTILGEREGILKALRHRKIDADAISLVESRLEYLQTLVETPGKWTNDLTNWSDWHSQV
jgi:hypothetical protein